MKPTLEKLITQVTSIIARSHAQASDFAVEAQLNDVSHYDLVLRTVGDSPYPTIELWPNWSDIGSHAESDADTIAKAAGALNERQARKAEALID